MGIYHIYPNNVPDRTANSAYPDQTPTGVLSGSTLFATHPVVLNTCSIMDLANPLTSMVVSKVVQMFKVNYVLVAYSWSPGVI